MFQKRLKTNLGPVGDAFLPLSESHLTEFRKTVIMSPAMASPPGIPESPNTPPFGGGAARPDGAFGPDFAGGGGGRGPRRPDGPYVDETCTAQERSYGLYMHLIGLLGLSSFPVPLAGLIGAGIMWKIKGDTSPYLDDHGREAVNFQLSLLLYGVVLAILLSLSPSLSSIAQAAMVVLSAVGCIRGSMASHRGEYYRYPMTIRFLKGG